jgi:hypothetical protein
MREQPDPLIADLIPSDLNPNPIASEQMGGSLHELAPLKSAFSAQQERLLTELQQQVWLAVLL